MNTTQAATRTAPAEIIIKLDRKGTRRATYFSHRVGRIMPLPIAEADLFIATGQSVRATVHPLTGEAL